MARLVAGLDLVDHVDFSTTADNLAGRVTLLRGFDGGDDFHKAVQNTDRAQLCQEPMWTFAMTQGGRQERLVPQRHTRR